MSIQNEAKTYLARYFTGEAASSQSDEAARVLRIGAKAKELLCVILSEAKNPGFRKRACKRQEKRESLRGDLSTPAASAQDDGGGMTETEKKNLREAMLGLLLAPPSS